MSWSAGGESGVPRVGVKSEMDYAMSDHRSGTIKPLLLRIYAKWRRKNSPKGRRTIAGRVADRVFL
jgi:hypothetical protein